MTTWYVNQRFAYGWLLFEGAGPNGGDWMAKRQGHRAVFGSKEEAVAFIGGWIETMENFSIELEMAHENRKQGSY